MEWNPALKAGKELQMKGSNQNLRSMFESLERRQMLSATPAGVVTYDTWQDDGGNISLYVNGDSAANNIGVTANFVANGTFDEWGRALGSANVTISTGKKLSKSFSNISNIQIYGGDGADKITLSGKMSEGQVWVWLGGGDGADTITIKNFDGGVGASGGRGADTIDASAAFSKKGALIGGNSHRSLNGDEGDDLLIGSSSSDSLSGGDGNDTLRGNAGDDYLYGGTGTNRLYGGDGNDSFQVMSKNGLWPGDIWNVGGDDVIDGGAGTDSIQRIFNSELGTPTFGDSSINVEQSYTYDYAGFGGGEG